MNDVIIPPGKDEGIGSNAPRNTSGTSALVDSNSGPNVFQPVLPDQIQYVDTGMIGSDGIKQKIMEHDQIGAPNPDQPGLLLRESATGAYANNNDDRNLKILLIVGGVAVGVLIFEPYLRRWVYNAFPKAKQQIQPQSQLKKQTERPTLYSVQLSPPESWKTVF